MKNFEKYEKEIKELRDNNYCNIPGFYDSLGQLLDIDTSTWTVVEVVDWLYSQEELLTKEEKDYLKEVIKPFREYVVNITKGNLFLNIKLSEGYSCQIPIDYTYPFHKLYISEPYTLGELGL